MIAMFPGQLPTRIAFLLWTLNPRAFAISWGWGLAVAGLILVAVLLVWLASRRAAALGAVAAGTATVAYDISTIAPIHLVLMPFLTVLLPLAALVLLSRGPERPPRLWLWLPGLVVAQPVATQLAAAIHWYPGFLFSYPQFHLWLVMFAVAWIGVDARPAVALAKFLALLTAHLLINAMQNLSGPFRDANIHASLWQWLAAVLVLAVLALWRVRRQAVL